MDIIIILLLLIIAAEASYLVTESRRKNRRIHQSPIFIDTSVLIDGRITSVAQSGFISRPLYIPRSVVGELQFLADNGDADKRSRARHGLDIINQLQSIDAVTVVIFADSVRAQEGVDNRLLELATTHNGALCTIDYNLNKVAVVQGIQVLNINELAKTLRMAYLPGEKMKIELTQKGNDQHQGVGHLPDGTMVVVEQGHRHIGSIVEVEFIRALQTAAGKMMFAKLVQTVPGSRTQAKKSAKKTDTVVSAKQAKPKGTKPPVKQASEERSATPKASATRPVRAPRGVQSKSAGESYSSTNTTVRQRAQSKSRRRKSPEDTMVELANK